MSSAEGAGTVSNILLLGGSSFLGQELTRLLAPHFQCFTLSRAEGFDLTRPDPESLARFIHEHSIHAVALIAALTDVDHCRREPELSRQVNFLGYQELLSPLVSSSVIPILFSTNNVLSGDHPFSTEAEVPEPKMIYGQHKLELENFLLKNFPHALIFRTSRILSQTKHLKNPLWDLQQKLASGQPLFLPSDRKLTPVFSSDIALAMTAALRKGATGVFHLAMHQGYTWFEIGELVKKQFHLSGELRPLVTVDNEQGVGKEVRPVHSTLSNEKVKGELGMGFKLFETSLEWPSAI